MSTPGAPLSVDDVFDAGIAATWTTDHDRAIELLSQAEALGHPEAAWELGGFYRKLGRFTEAEGTFRRAIAAGGVDADVTLANMLADDLDRSEEAMALYRDAIARGVEVAYRNLASELTSQGRPDEAVALLVDRPAPDFATLVSLGIAYEKQGELERALEVYDRLAEMKPEGHSYRAAVLHDLGDFDAAVVAYRTAIAEGYEKAATFLGYLYAEHGMDDEAEAVYREALDAGNHDVLLNYGNFVSEFEGRDDEAIELYEHAIAAGITDGHLNLALHLEDLGRFDDAEAQFQKALEVRDRTAPDVYKSYQERRARDAQA